MIALCSPWLLNLRAHDPVRVSFLGWRCRDCSAVASTEEELLGAGSGHVDPERREFWRDPRYVRRDAA